MCLPSWMSTCGSKAAMRLACPGIVKFDGLSPSPDFEVVHHSPTVSPRPRTLDMISSITGVFASA